MARPCADDEIVVADTVAVSQLNISSVHIDARHFTEEDADVAAVTHDPPDRGSNVARGKGGGGHLVEQRLEDVMVPPIEDGHATVRVSEHSARRQPGKSASDDDDVWFRHVPLLVNFT
jgi:hypothetical protein